MSLSSDLSLMSTSSDEEIILPRRVVKDRTNPFDMYDDRKFWNRYRLSKTIVMKLLNCFGRFIEPSTHRNKSLSAKQQLLLTLRFYASGGFQQTVADHIHVHKTTACRIIKKVTLHIAQLRPQYVKMPITVEERAAVKNGFYAIAQFPNVIGAIDCTYIKIQSPGGVDAERFRNSKGYFSLNIQAVCDADLRIRDVIARWPGSVHDSIIFNNSPLRGSFETTNVFGNDFLLGDNNYPCLKYLLTPFLIPATKSEEAYNSAHNATRSTIDHCFGALKKRFPCLSMGLRVKVETSMPLIVACCILHNMAIDNNDTIKIDINENGDHAVGSEVNNIIIPNVNTKVRTTLMETFFCQITD